MLRRTYTLWPSGADVELQIEEPQFVEGTATCTFQIIVDGSLWKDFTSAGVDELQSLQLALLAADANLSYYSRKTVQHLLWNGELDRGLAPECLTCGRGMA